MKNCPKLNAVVFDLDDTLYPESQYVRSGLLAVGRYLEDRRVCSSAKFYSIATKVFEEGFPGRVFDESLYRIGIKQSQNQISELVSVYRQHKPSISLYSDARECLTLLSQQFQLGIITDGPAIAQRRKVEALDLNKWINHVIYTDDHGLSFWKPHPKPYLDIQTKMNVDAQFIVYVGDNPAKDFFGARCVGWKSIRIKRKGTMHFTTQPNVGYHPDFQFGSLSKLATWLTN